MKFGSFLRAGAGAILAFTLAACGGGGGGGGTTAPGGGEGAGFGEVAIHLRSPSSVRDVALAGGSPHPVELQIDYSGATDALAGQTLYVLVEVPDPLYESRPIFHLDANAPIVHLTLGGTLQGLPEGRYTGTMKVYACLDPACATQLRNSPLAIPYDVEMKPSLKLSQERLDLQADFGTALPASEITVSPPFGGTDWSLVAGDAMGIGVARAGDKLVITPSPSVRPGVYTSDVIVEASAPDPMLPATTLRLGRTLKVSYTVRASAVAYVMSPATASYTMAAGDPTQANGRVNFALQDPLAQLSMRGVRYDASPAAAAGHPGVGQWLSAGPPNIGEYFVIPCGVIPGVPDCLPPGTYRAAILYRHSLGGVDTDFEHAVTMTIAP